MMESDERRARQRFPERRGELAYTEDRRFNPRIGTRRFDAGYARPGEFGYPLL